MTTTLPKEAVEKSYNKILAVLQDFQKKFDEDPKKVNQELALLVQQKKPLYLSRGIKKEQLEPLYSFGEYLIAHKEPQKASTVYTFLNIFNCFDIRGVLGLAASCDCLHDNEHTLEYYSQALSIDSKNSFVLMKIILHALILKRFSLASEKLKETIKLFQQKHCTSFNKMEARLFAMIKPLVFSFVQQLDREPNKEITIIIERINRLDTLIKFFQREKYRYKK